MRVLHFYKTYYPDTFGGVEKVICQLAESGKPLGIEADVHVLSPHGKTSHERFMEHTVHRSTQDLFIASTGFSVSAFRDFSNLAKSADLIHYHFPWPFMDLVHFATRTGKPSVVTYHSDIVKQKHLLALYRPLMNRFLSSVDHIVATSPNYVETSPVLQRFKDKTSVVPIGLEPNDYPKSSPELLAKWQSRVGTGFFLFVGALRYYKGLHILLAAMKGMDLPLVILGAGPMEQELVAQARECGLNKIHFVGALPDEDKNALLELSGVFVFPSHLRSEAFGISLLEAAMYGKPMISSEIGTGTTYINIGGETGEVVPPDSPAQLRLAMAKLWADPQLCRRYGQAARERFMRLFTAREMAGRYHDIYGALLQPDGARSITGDLGAVRS